MTEAEARIAEFFTTLAGWRGFVVGSASAYPLKVSVPGKGQGQYKVSECFQDAKGNT